MECFVMTFSIATRFLVTLFRTETGCSVCSAMRLELEFLRCSVRFCSEERCRSDTRFCEISRFELMNWLAENTSALGLSGFCALVLSPSAP